MPQAEDSATYTALEQHVKRVVFQAGHGHLSDSLYFLLQVDGGGSRLMMNHIGPHLQFQKHPRPAMNWSLIAAREGVVATASTKGCTPVHRSSSENVPQLNKEMI